MSGTPLVEPEALPPSPKAIHDATPEEYWTGRQFRMGYPEGHGYQWYCVGCPLRY